MDTFNSKLTQAKEAFRVDFANNNPGVDAIRQRAMEIAVLDSLISKGLGGSLYDPSTVKEQKQEMDKKGMSELLAKMDYHELIDVINDPKKFEKKLNEFQASKESGSKSNDSSEYVPTPEISENKVSYMDELEKQVKKSYGFAKMSAQNAQQALGELQNMSKKNPDEIDEEQMEKAKNNMAKVIYNDVLQNDEKALKTAQNTKADSKAYENEINKLQNSDTIKSFTNRLTFDGIAEFSNNPKTYKQHLAAQREEKIANEKTIQKQKELVKQQPSKGERVL